LEAGYIIFKLPPYYRNLNKRLVKSPKLYFYDTGLVCSLLGIETVDQLANYPLRGAIFETMVISELVKAEANQGRRPGANFLGDKSGREIDYVLSKKRETIAVEIKAGQTVKSEFFANLKYWQNLGLISKNRSFIVYGGEESQHRKQGKILSWRKIKEIAGL
jgi:hypothetical protein